MMRASEEVGVDIGDTDRVLHDAVEVRRLVERGVPTRAEEMPAEPPPIGGERGNDDDSHSCDDL